MENDKDFPNKLFKTEYWNGIVEIDEESLQYLKRKIENMNQTAKLQARLYPRTSKNGTDYLAVKFKPYEAIPE